MVVVVVVVVVAVVVVVEVVEVVDVVVAVVVVVVCSTVVVVVLSDVVVEVRDTSCGTDSSGEVGILPQAASKATQRSKMPILRQTLFIISSPFAKELIDKLSI